MGARVGTFVLALLFLFIAVASSAIVIWQIHQEDKSTASSATTTPTSTAKPQEGKLEGTKLEGFTPTTAPVTQIQSTDTTVGTGDEVKPGDTVTADYTGAVAATGVIFQSSKDSGAPVPFSLNSVIKGWSEGVPGMKVGGTRRLVIPAADAYGANPPSGSGIPPNADLVFDVTVVKIGQ